MKAVVVHEYGPPRVLKLENIDDPRPGPDEVLVRVLAGSVNPVDWKRRSGELKQMFPIEFPGIIGVDVAGVVQEFGKDVQGFAAGDRVFAFVQHAYAELCVVKAAALAKIPEGLEITAAGAIPLVSVTGDQLIRKAAEVQKGQTILLTGALGSVGRCALFSALELGAKVIAGVRKKQLDEARELGAVEAIDLGDEAEIAKLGFVDAVADAVGGELSIKLLGKVKEGGIYASLTGPPKGAELHPRVKIKMMSAEPDPQTLVHFGEAIRDGKLKLPIDRIMPLAEAAEAHEIGEKGGVGKIVLTS